MLYTKDYLGDYTFNQYTIRYFIIKKDTLYGVEIEENQQVGCTCQSEYFTENKDMAYTLGQKMQANGVTPTHMADIIDDFIQ